MASSEKIEWILASSSPRRKELLGHLGVNFEICLPDIRETHCYEHAKDIVLDLSQKKAEAVKRTLSLRNHIGIIAADTVVSLKGKVLEKPKDKEEARQMLLSLSGRDHEVYTGVSVYYKEKLDSFFECSKVYMNEIPELFLNYYIDSGEPMDKAGSYGIQGAALVFIKKIEGCYANVMGFPLAEFVKRYSKLLF